VEGFIFKIRYRLSGNGYNATFLRTYSNWGTANHAVLPFMVVFERVPAGANYKFVIGAGGTDTELAIWNTTQCTTDGADYLSGFYEIVPDKLLL
jgi:hypothetical protein